MAKSILSNQFDIEKYISERLLEVKGLEERVILKEVLNDLFLELYNNTEKQYLDLESRVLNEVTKCEAQPTIITGLMDKKHYDKTDLDLIPMRLEDLDDVYIDEQVLQESIQANRPFFLYTIFIERDYLKLKELIKKDRTFFGTVKTEHGEYKATFVLRMNKSYLKKIEQLYEVFLNNYIPWHTVCMPYLHKLFNVYVTHIHNWEAQEKILQAKVDFEEYSEFIKYDLFPVWNITTVEEKTSTFPEPCVDTIYYEHIIFKNTLQENKTYLVANTDVELSNIRQIDGDLHITCNQPHTQRWIFYVVNSVPEKRRNYPLMMNKEKTTFSGHIRDNYQRQIKTKTELMRYITSLGYDDYIKIKDMDIVEDPFMMRETYNMDGFIEDEIRLEKRTYQLILKFEAVKKDNFLTRDIMSYLVSCVGYMYPEYECLGKLV